MPEALRCLVCSDLHAAEGTYRKLLNAVRLNLYGARVVIVAGDLTGKAMVPVVEQAGGRFLAEWEGEGEAASRGPELDGLLRRLSDRGLYPFLTSPEEVAHLRENPDQARALFEKLMVERMESWIALAEERIGPTGVLFFIMPGNDDTFAIDAAIDRSGVVLNPARRVLPLAESHEILGFDYSPPTPWKTPREMPEEEIERTIAVLAVQVKDLRRAVFVLHVPPYDSGLDIAPALDPHLRPTASLGELLKVPVGSKGVRRAIERLQPLVSLSGHIHESAGQTRIGRTLCLNAGSEADSGILRGYLFDLEGDRVVEAYRFEG